MGIEPRRQGNQFGFAVPANVYDCTDGKVYVAVLLDSHWKILARTIGFAELADDEDFATAVRRSAHRDACNAMLGGWLAERTRAEAIDVFERAGLAIAPVTARRPGMSTSASATCCSRCGSRTDRRSRWWARR